MQGSTAIAYNNTDPVALAKALTAYAKANPVFVFRAGMVEGRVVNIADLGAIASLPSKEELIVKLLYLLLVLKATPLRLNKSVLVGTTPLLYTLLYEK